MSRSSTDDVDATVSVSIKKFGAGTKLGIGLGDDQERACVCGVESWRSASEASKLQEGDEVVEINGRRVRNAEEVRYASTTGSVHVVRNDSTRNCP